MELPHRREPPRRRATPSGPRSSRLARKAADRRGVGLGRAPAGLGKKGEIVVEVAAIGFEGVAGGAALGGEHVEEEVAEARRRSSRLAGFEEGTGTVISRGSGWTKVASANMAAKPRPARTATNEQEPEQGRHRAPLVVALYITPKRGRARGGGSRSRVESADAKAGGVAPAQTRTRP